MLNSITLHGYLGRDPELNEYEGANGSYKKVSFSIAVSRDYGDETDWFRCVMFGKRADVIAKYFEKGSEIIVKGRMESYRPKTDDSRIAWNVRVDDFNFCGKSTNRPYSSEETPEGFTEVFDDEDAPF